jgi:hypothetical protein
LTRVVLHPQAHARQRKTHGAAAALGLTAVARISMAGVGREHDRLAHAVAFQDGVAGALLPFVKVSISSGAEPEMNRRMLRGLA